MIPTFIQRARRRFLWNEVLAQFAFAAALLMAGIILLLLLGTEILNWQVIAVLVLAGFGVGVYRTWKHLPSPYRIAILLDQRAGLHDALSTALFFGSPQPQPAGAVNASVRDIQRSYAESLLPSIHLDSAIPFTLPRAVYAMGVLGLIASSLFALRYGIRRQLDLRPPLTQVVMDGFGLNREETKTAALQKKKNAGGNPNDPLDTSAPGQSKNGEKKPNDMETSPANAPANAAAGSPEGKDSKSIMGEGKEKGDAKGQGTAENADTKDAKEENAQAGTPSNGKTNSENPSGSQQGQPQGEQAASQQQNGGNNSSLLSKMKEAMSNLMAKAKPQSNSASGQKGSQGQQGAQKAQNQQQNGQKGADGKGQEGGQQDSNDAQQGQQSADADSSENSQSKGGSKNADNQASSQPGSGVGKQDGSKDVKAAEQKAAMGKLSEVIGKRSQNITGEMMVESQSGPQQLKTQYSHKNATHGESGGEVSRDEVPVSMQSYVQQYFEEVRKVEHTGVPAKAKTAAKPTGKEQPSQ